MTFDTRELPILDLDLLSGNVESLVETAEESLRELGFFVVRNHGVSTDLIQRTFGRSRLHKLCTSAAPSGLRRNYRPRGPSDACSEFLELAWR